MRLRHIARIAACLAPVSAAVAQQVRGTIRDSASSLPVPGAVVVALDSTGGVVGRNIADGAGRYLVVVRAPATQLQVVRIGYRPRTLSLQAADLNTFDIALTAIPTLLEHVRVIADRSQCPARNDAAETLALVDQARAGLLATIVAREANPAEVTRLAYERVLDANGIRTVSQSVRMEQADRATVSFNAAQTAIDFTQRGFASDSGPNRTFYGPDADVLLDDGFASGYCYRIGDADREHPNLIALAFSPSGRRRGRVDIDGALWVDTVARKLSHVEFRYLGLDNVSEGFGSGGRVSFREVSPGITLIDRWSLRLIGQAGDSTGSGARTYQISEIGGELAAASWPDGRTWSAPLGALRLTAVTSSNAPAAGAVVGLLNTHYTATVDSAGQADFGMLVPGPYSAVVVEPRLAAIGLTLPLDVSFVATRDSIVERRTTVPSVAEFVATLCRAPERRTANAAYLIGRVGTADGRVASDSRWRIARSGEGGWIPVAEGGTTGSSGIFTHCRNVTIGQTVQIQAWRNRESPAVVVRRIDDSVAVVPVIMPSVVTARRGATSAGPVAGIVLDSASGRPEAGAFIELVGTQLTAITDTAGEFRIASVPSGQYTAEIRTQRLDALGAVGRSIVDFSAGAPRATLHVPTMSQLMTAMCGPDTPLSAGMLVGRLQLADSNPPAAGVRLVAEWHEGAPSREATDVTSGARPGRTVWIRTRPDETGTFRLCGVPVGVPLVVRAQVDTALGAAVRPVAVEVDSVARFARLDLRMEPGLTLGAAFAGDVVADSTDDPIAGAEVAFPDLKISVSTNESGGFRINDIPAGTHRVLVRRPGYRPITAQLDFVANQTVDHHIVLGAPTSAAPLDAVNIVEDAGVNATFDENRKLGLGKFVTSSELEAHRGRPLSDALASLPTMAAVAAGGGFVVGRRVPPKLFPRPVAPVVGATSGATDQPARNQCGGGFEADVRCSFTADDLRDQGYYCPQAGERRVACACFAQIWVDGRLMNTQRPTEPFDINVIPVETLIGVEWYASPSQTPARYSSFSSPCGVMALWTRASGGH